MDDGGVCKNSPGYTGSVKNFERNRPKYLLNTHMSVLDDKTKIWIKHILLSYIVNIVFRKAPVSQFCVKLSVFSRKSEVTELEVFDPINFY